MSYITVVRSTVYFYNLVTKSVTVDPVISTRLAQASSTTTVGVSTLVHRQLVVHELLTPVLVTP